MVHRGRGYIGSVVGYIMGGIETVYSQQPPHTDKNDKQYT